MNKSYFFQKFKGQFLRHKMQRPVSQKPPKNIDFYFIPLMNIRFRQDYSILIYIYYMFQFPAKFYLPLFYALVLFLAKILAGLFFCCLAGSSPIQLWIYFRQASGKYVQSISFFFSRFGFRVCFFGFPPKVCISNCVWPDYWTYNSQEFIDLRLYFLRGCNQPNPLSSADFTHALKICNLLWKDSCCERHVCFKLPNADLTLPTSSYIQDNIRCSKTQISSCLL